MKNFTKLLLMTTALVGVGCSNGTPKGGFLGFNIHADSGQAYKDCIECSENSKSYDKHCGDGYRASCKAALLVSRDLTDEEIEDAKKGSGYSNGQWAGENPPMNEDEHGNPTYAAQQVWDDGETIYILEDDGEITEMEIADYFEMFQDYMACLECSGYENIHFIEIDSEYIIVEINGVEHTIETKGGFWTDIDPETGKITQRPI